MNTDLKSISKQQLIEQTLFLASEEKRIDLALIEHLREIENRRLYLELAYSSLWDFCVRHLKLSEGSAQRKISTMRLCRDVPDTKKALESGTLNVVNAAQLQSFFNAEKREGIVRSQ